MKLSTLSKKTIIVGLLAGFVLLFMALNDSLIEDAYAFHTEAELAQFESLRGGGLPGGIGNYFRGSGHCYGCHGPDLNNYASVDANGVDVNVADDWRSTMMANAARDPFWRAKVSHETLVNPAHEEALEAKCTSCHAPMGHFDKKFSGLGLYAMDDLDTDQLGIDGVSCLACHMQSPDSIGQLFSGEVKFDTNLVAYGPYDNMFTGPMVSFVGYEPKLGDHVTEGSFCAGCHTLITQTVDLAGNYTGGEFVEQATYHEWVNSVYDGSVSCQECHVPRIADPVVISANYLFLTGKSPFGMHHFQGANVFMLELMKSNMQQLGLSADSVQFDSTIARTDRMLKNQTLMIDVSIPQRTPDTAFVDVLLTNLVGHKFPSGYPSRRAFVEFVALDANNDTLFKSGVLQSDYEVEGHNATWEPHYDVIREGDQVQIYEHVMGDVNGDKTTVLERANANLKDNRITPAGFSTSHYAYDTTQITNVSAADIDFNRDAAGVEGSGSDIVHYHIPMNNYSGLIKVSARVYYQTAPPAWMTEMFSYNSADIDSFRTMYDNADQQPILVVEDTLSDDRTSVPELDQLGFNIYPNPSSSGFLFIDGPLSTARAIQVFGADGRLVHTEVPNGTVIRLALKPGTYIIAIETERGVSSAKAVVL